MSVSPKWLNINYLVVDLYFLSLRFSPFFDVSSAISVGRNLIP